MWDTSHFNEIFGFINKTWSRERNFGVLYDMRWPFHLKDVVDKCKNLIGDLMILFTIANWASLFKFAVYVKEIENVSFFSFLFWQVLLDFKLDWRKQSKVAISFLYQDQYFAFYSMRRRAGHAETKNEQIIFLFEESSQIWRSQS